MSSPFHKYILALCCLFLSSACINTLPRGNAMVLEPSLSSVTNNVVILNLETEVPYKFAVANKLNGNGAVQVSINKNKINASAKGIGRVDHHSVDLTTQLEGSINKDSGDIDINFTGIASPIKMLIPGAITFSGPLKGIFEDGILKLVGTVQVNGFIARRAGFAETEKVVIEIEDSALCKNLINLKRKVVPT